MPRYYKIFKVRKQTFHQYPSSKKQTMIKGGMITQSTKSTSQQGLT
jgi:hypothetical protein